MILELGTTPVVPQIRKWLRGVDLNHRPLGYEPNELPDCSTPHFDHSNQPECRQTSHCGSMAAEWRFMNLRHDVERSKRRCTRLNIAASKKVVRRMASNGYFSLMQPMPRSCD